MPKPKRKKRHQIAAIPLRRHADGGLEVVLITSRTTHRWIVPKGWPMKGKADHKAAAIEAHEEAGLIGRMLREPVGAYTYWRRTRTHFRLTEVIAYAMAAEGQSDDWKESGQRTHRWFTIDAAAELVDEPELQDLLAGLPTNVAVERFVDRRS